MSGLDISVPDIAALAERRSEKWASEGPGVLAMTVAEMDFPLAPAVSAVLRQALERSDVGYPTAVPARLNEAFAEFARRRLDWEVDPEQVTLAPDVVVAAMTLLGALLKPGEEVAMAVPAYPPFFSEIPRAGLRLRELALRPAGEMDLDELEAALREGARALLLVNPQNPTGRVLRRAELERVAELCAEHGAWVLADEIHAPLTMPGTEFVPWLEVSPAARERGFVLTSASKAFNLAGLKAAHIVTAADGPADVVRSLPPIGHAAGLFGVLASEAAFERGDEWLDAVLAQLEANRELLGAELAQRLPEVRWTPPQGTYLAWLDCRALGLGADPAAAFLERGRVALGSGPRYGGAGFVRLNFATSPELVREGVRRMAAALPGAS
ncbi:MAG TPA: aminotransferase class I/II-fold pyridoxal phosphate-dependent enzyme [Solirubrobacterales bacterium]|nr:aminotransferase class I/II-fold pyridoxal phosphate-dependent enzyme [Solirubrobacterales bacterium]